MEKCVEVIGTLNFSSCKSGSESDPGILFKLCREFYLSLLISIQKRRLRFTEFVFEIKATYRAVLDGFFAAMVTYYDTSMRTSC